MSGRRDPNPDLTLRGIPSKLARMTGPLPLASLSPAGRDLSALIEQLRQLRVERRVVPRPTFPIRHASIESVVREMDHVRFVSASPDLHGDLHTHLPSRRPVLP